MTAIESHAVSGVIILRVTGKLIVGGALRQFREHVAELLLAGFTKILVDVAATTQMDNAGVGELLMAYEIVSITGGEIKLLNLAKGPHEVSHRMILSAAFETFEEESCAIHSYSRTCSAQPPKFSAPEASEFQWIDGWPRLIGRRNAESPAGLRNPAPKVGT